jgi:hypothetical protein
MLTTSARREQYVIRRHGYRVSCKSRATGVARYVQRQPQHIHAVRRQSQHIHTFKVHHYAHDCTSKTGTCPRISFMKKALKANMTAVTNMQADPLAQRACTNGNFTAAGLSCAHTGAGLVGDMVWPPKQLMVYMKRRCLVWVLPAYKLDASKALPPWKAEA